MEYQHQPCVSLCYLWPVLSWMPPNRTTWEAVREFEAALTLCHEELVSPASLMEAALDVA